MTDDGGCIGWLDGDYHVDVAPVKIYGFAHLSGRTEG
jgi:hypothetical protein